MSKFSNALRWILSLVGAVACWKMAYTLYQTWQTPLAVENGRWVSLGVGIMVMEFILLHSGIMIPSLAASEKLKYLGRKPVLIVSICYIVFGVTIAFVFKSTLLFWTFSGIMLPRWMKLFLEPDTPGEKQGLRSYESFFVYFMAVILFILVPFPRGGLTPAVLNQVYAGRGGGLWEQSPQQALVAGVVYFTLIGLLEVTSPLRKKSFLQSPITGCFVLLVILGVVGLMVCQNLFGIFH